MLSASFVGPAAGGLNPPVTATSRWCWPTGSRACRSASARSCPRRGAAGAPCSRRRGWRQCSWTASSDGAWRPARGSTMAATRWPKRSSGAPTTMASITSGCDRTTDSTSSGKIFSPPELMQIEPRPRSVTDPSASTVAKSPGITNCSAVDGDEHFGALHGVVVVPDGDVAGAGDLPDHPRPGLHRLEVLVEDDGAAGRGRPSGRSSWPWLPGLIIEIPLLPDSDDPMASVMIRFGNCAKKASLTGGGEERRGRGDADQRRQVVGRPGLGRGPR